MPHDIEFHGSTFEKEMPLSAVSVGHRSAAMSAIPVRTGRYAVSIFGATVAHGVVLALLAGGTHPAVSPVALADNRMIEFVFASPTAVNDQPAPDIETAPAPAPSMPSPSIETAPTEAPANESEPLALTVPDALEESDLTGSVSPPPAAQTPIQPTPVPAPQPTPATVHPLSERKPERSREVRRATPQASPAPIAGTPGTRNSQTDSGVRAALIARIRSAVQAAAQCPAAARMIGQSGKAGVAFDYRDGRVAGDLRLARSSGTPILDAAALNAVRHARYPEAPPEEPNQVLHLLIWVEESCGDS